MLELRAEEPRRAIVSLEMWLRGGYIVPQIHDWSYYNKPPLFNWYMLLFFKLLGSCEEWVVRLPSLIAFIGTAVLNYFIVKRYLSKEVALFSSLFLLTSADLLFYGTLNAGEIDLFFSFLVYSQVMAIFVCFEKKQYLLLFLLSYTFAALGTLTKGLPSIAFQGLTILPWLIINGRWKLLFDWKHILGILTYILIVGGYFYTYSNHDDALGFMSRLFNEASNRTALEHHFIDTLKATTIFPFYLLRLLLPWSLFSIFFFRKDLVQVIKKHSILRFSLVFIFFNIPLYWFSADHKARYLYMFFPFFCILFSYFFLHAPISFRKWKKGIEYLLFSIIIIGTFAFIAVPFISQTSEIDGIIWKCILLFMFGFALLLSFHWYPNWRLNTFILFVILLRLGFNFIYLPAAAQHSNSMIYKNHIAQILTITNKEPVHWAGEPYQFKVKKGIGPLTFGETSLTTAPLVAYQIPYYLTKGNRHIMRFDTSLKAQRYYLAHESFLKKEMEVKVLYRFPDKFLKKEVVLFFNEF